jgi:nitroreductase/NAD-dependent dihydropyrimidine dehydrogenase PreA subunit
MQNSVTTIIDPDTCIGCGLCVEVCPAKTISMQDGKAVVTGTYSMGCGHCEAVCPTGAIQVEALEHPFTLSCGTVDDRWLPHGEYDTGQLVRLMRSRRSCRNFKDKEVDRKVLEDLVKIGTTAPSGTNAQLWTFSILSSRSEVVALGKQMAWFFHNLNRMAEKSWLRLFSRIFSGDTLGRYYHRYYETVKEGLLLWDREGVDTLFHGAAAVILVGGKKSASSPMEDGLLASQNILLAAHSLGLGSCMIGFAVEAIKRDKQIRQMLEIPDDESVYAVIALGYPAEKYQKTAHRKKIIPRYPLVFINKNANNI